MTAISLPLSYGFSDTAGLRALLALSVHGLLLERGNRCQGHAFRRNEPTGLAN